MSAAGSPTIADASLADRVALEGILAESFEGWYLRHSMRTLREIERVRVASAAAGAIGLSMLKSLETGDGYVYYVAVAGAFRRQGVGSALLDDALSIFRAKGASIVFASVENEEAESLFSSKGFARTGFSEVTRRYGLIRAVSMYRSMLVVPGEALLQALLGQETDATPASRGRLRQS